MALSRVKVTSAASRSFASLSSLPLPPGDVSKPFEEQKIDYALGVHLGQAFGRPTVYVCKAEFLRKVLGGEHVIVQTDWPEITKNILGPKSLASQSGDIHRSRRKMLSGAFRQSNFEEYVPRMGEKAVTHLNRWILAPTPFLGCHGVRAYTFDIAADLLLGFDFNPSELQAWMQNFGVLTRGLFLPQLYPESMKMRPVLLAALQQNVERIVKERQSQKQPTSGVVLQRLLELVDENNEKLSRDEVIDQALLMLFAGHDTSTTAISSFLMTLGDKDHRYVLLKLKEEQKKFKNERLTPDVISEMTYLDAVVKEILRLLPPVLGGFRRVTQDFDLGGYRIPKDHFVQYSILDAHLHSPNFSNPEKFNPDRFFESPSKSLSSREDKKLPGSFIPFGLGARQCLGMTFANYEIKLLVVNLLRKYDWELVNPKPKMHRFPTLEPMDHLPIVLKPTKF